MTVFSTDDGGAETPLKLTRVEVRPSLNAHGLQLLDQAAQLRVVLAVQVLRVVLAVQVLRVVLAVQVLRVQVGREVEEAAQRAAVVLKGREHCWREGRVTEVVIAIPAIQPVDLSHTRHDAVGKEARPELYQDLIQHETAS